jgi:hypothetical protein
MCVIKDKLDHFEEKLLNYTDFLTKNVKSRSGTGTIIPDPDPTWPKSPGSYRIRDPQHCNNVPTLSLSSSKKDLDKSFLFRNTSVKQMIMVKHYAARSPHCILPKKTTALFVVAVDKISSFLIFLLFYSLTGLD